MQEYSHPKEFITAIVKAAIEPELPSGIVLNIHYGEGKDLDDFLTSTITGSAEIFISFFNDDSLSKNERGNSSQSGESYSVFCQLPIDMHTVKLAVKHQLGLKNQFILSNKFLKKIATVDYLGSQSLYLQLQLQSSEMRLQVQF